MPRRLLQTLGILILLLALPAAAGASVAFTKIVAPYTFTSQPLNSAIYVAADDGTGVRKLAVSGSEPLLSPDGTIIAYAKVISTKKADSTTIDSYILHFVTVATGADVNTKLQCQNPSWAPDSSAVACNLTTTLNILTSGSGQGLVTVTPTGTVTMIAENTATVSVGWNSATWSPDSSMIAWESNVSSPNVTSGFNPPKLRAMKADGTGSLIKLGANASMAVWGPTRIAYQAHSGSGDSLTSEVWTVDPATHNNSTATQLTHWAQPKHGTDSGPAPLLWTPNGKTIIGTIMGLDADATTVSINAATGKITTIGTDDSNSPAAVSSDGSSILVYYYSQACCATKAIGTVRTVSLATGKSALFMKNVSFLSASADWMP